MAYKRKSVYMTNIMNYKNVPCVIVDKCEENPYLVKALYKEEIICFYKNGLGWQRIIGWGNYSGTLFFKYYDQFNMECNIAVPIDQMSWYWKNE